MAASMASAGGWCLSLIADNFSSSLLFVSGAMCLVTLVTVLLIARCWRSDVPDGYYWCMLLVPISAGCSEWYLLSVLIPVARRWFLSILLVSGVCRYHSS